MNRPNVIQVFEYQLLQVGGKFQKKHLKALSNLNALHNYCYFDLLYNGVKFKNYVGVIQVDDICIEILPKIDNNATKSLWQDVLIDMLKETGRVKVQQTQQATIAKQQRHLLDIYFEWFLHEVKQLIHQGLIKQYYTETKNVTALKGKLQFAGHLQKNLIHKERFYTTHQVYHYDHTLHQLIALALQIVAKLSKGTSIYNRCKTIMLDFPEVSTIKPTAALFAKLKLNRKSAPYKTALEIARLIILNYAPNVKSGSEDMLAILFDMNTLWEEYVLVKLKKAAGEHITVYGQQSKPFWNSVTIRPDIIIEKRNLDNTTETIVMDTKWKQIDNYHPSTHDLRQMYVYNEYWSAKQSVLLYPTTATSLQPKMQPFANNAHACSVAKVNILQQNVLNHHIGNEILQWFE